MFKNLKFKSNNKIMKLKEEIQIVSELSFFKKKKKKIEEKIISLENKLACRRRV